MAKQKKRGHQHKGGIMARSDIPFARRKPLWPGALIVSRKI